jgi:hypothetical protein
MSGCALDNTIEADCDAAKALAHMNKTGSGRLLVLDGHRLVGVGCPQGFTEILGVSYGFRRNGELA